MNDKHIYLKFFLLMTICTATWQCGSGVAESPQADLAVPYDAAQTPITKSDGATSNDRNPAMPDATPHVSRMAPICHAGDALDIRQVFINGAQIRGCAAATLIAALKVFIDGTGKSGTDKSPPVTTSNSFEHARLINPEQTDSKKHIYAGYNRQQRQLDTAGTMMEEIEFGLELASDASSFTCSIPTEFLNKDPNQLNPYHLRGSCALYGVSVDLSATAVAHTYDYVIAQSKDAGATPKEKYAGAVAQLLTKLSQITPTDFPLTCNAEGCRLRVSDGFGPKNKEVQMANYDQPWTTNLDALVISGKKASAIATVLLGKKGTHATSGIGLSDIVDVKITASTTSAGKLQVTAGIQNNMDPTKFFDTLSCTQQTPQSGATPAQWTCLWNVIRTYIRPMTRPTTPAEIEFFDMWDSPGVGLTAESFAPYDWDWLYGARWAEWVYPILYVAVGSKTDTWVNAGVRCPMVKLQPEGEGAIRFCLFYGDTPIGPSP